MSLINQMLRDLEARRAAEADQNNGVFRGLTTSLSRPGRPLLLITAVVLVTAALAVSGTWFWTKHQANQVANVTAAVQPSAPLPTPEPPKPAAATPAAATPAPAAQPVAPVPAAPVHAVEAAPAAPVANPKPAMPRVTAARDAVDDVEIVPRTPSAQQRAAQLYQEAVGLLRDRQPAAAEAKLRAALKADPGNLPAGETLAVLLMNAGRTIEAESIVEAARAHNNSRPTLELLAARIRVAHGDISGAINVLERGMGFSGGRPDYVSLLAALYQKQGRHRESAAAYERVVALEPDDASAWVGLAISDEALGKKAAALEAYSHALAGRLSATLRDYAEGRRRALQSGQAQ